MKRTISYLAISMALFSCDKGAMKKDDVRPETKADSAAETVRADRVYESTSESGDLEGWTDGAEFLGEGEECDDSECAYADDGEDPCGDGGLCDPPPVIHKKFTGKAAKVEKQIVKEQLRKDVAQVEALLKDLDTELASK